ncbi:hypothetical protein [Nocardioides rubriscoriae]|uniref:hypothetical protein n=1 Tax=Nocardioides rubriscoriae TaxID=642762 RepID=UPI001FE724B6|nr:hypothetical protein [Nocardioides rubriscoriae]
MARVAALNAPRPSPPFPRFAPVARLRPVALVQPGTDLPGAPYAAVERDLPDAGFAAEVSLSSGPTRYAATWDGTRVGLVTTVAGRTRPHVSRRHGRAEDPTGLALSLTGPFLTAWTREGERWVARAVVDLDEPGAPGGPDPHDEGWLAGLTADGDRAGCFGQLGLRDVRVVTDADGTPCTDDGRVLLTATSAGPGGFRTGHTSVWSLDPDTLDLGHRGDLFFRRPERPGVLGDHATHLVRDRGVDGGVEGDRWLVATSTWGDFDRRRRARVTTTVATVPATTDVTRGSHVLDTVALRLPTPPDSVGSWDPHLVRDGDGWWATYVSASRFFRFHPVVAQGPALDRMSLRASATGRTATEGPTLVRRDDRWWVLASDGRDGPRAHRARYPVLDLDLHQHGHLDAAYPTNLPWPSLVDLPGRRPLLVGFNGAAYGGPLLGYGTHGALVVQRAGED